METAKLLLQLVILVFPFIFKKDKIYDEKIKIVNGKIKEARKKFKGMSDDEKSIELSNLVDNVKRMFELRK